MSAIYTIDGKPHELCKCSNMSNVCPRGAKRPMQTAGYQQCFIPCKGIVLPLDSPASPHEQGETPEVDGLEFYAQWGSSGDGGNVIHADDARSLERRLREAEKDAQS